MYRTQNRKSELFITMCQFNNWVFKHKISNLDFTDIKYWYMYIVIHCNTNHLLVIWLKFNKLITYVLVKLFVEKDFSSHLNFLWDRTCKICLIMIFIVTCIKKNQYIFYLINNKILKMSTFILLLSTWIVFYIKFNLQNKPF